jgi:hypothetical protein
MKTTRSCCWIGGALLLWLAAAAAAATYREAQAVDKEVGILNHPWKTNVVSLLTSDYLRLRSQVKTGLQSFDQQVEKANESPPELMVILKPPPVSPATKEQEKHVSPASKPHPPGWEPPPVVIIIENP